MNKKTWFTSFRKENSSKTIILASETSKTYFYENKTTFFASVKCISLIYQTIGNILKCNS